MKKFLLAILMIMCLTAPAFAEINVNSSIDGEQVRLSGSSSYSEVPISLQVFDNDRKYYINQGQTAKNGDFQFSFKLEEGKKYTGRLNIYGEKEEFELFLVNSSHPVEKETAFIYINGYNGVILPKTEIKILNTDTVLSITKRIMALKGISYVDRNGYISSIDGQAEFEKGSKSGWVFSINGKIPNVGAENVDVYDGDCIEWFYTKNFGKDVGDGDDVAKEPIKLNFSDLQGYDWAKQAIEVMAAQEIVNGRSAEKFDPVANITRAEFTTLVTKTIGYAAENINVPFKDVAKDAWYYNYVGVAYKNGLINGRNEAAFDPNGNITRQEMTVIIAKVLAEKGYSQGTGKELDIFKDKEGIAFWAQNGTSICVKEGIINGMGNGTFAPKQNANRAQAVVMLYRLYQLIK